MTKIENRIRDIIQRFDPASIEKRYDDKAAKEKLPREKSFESVIAEMQDKNKILQAGLSSSEDSLAAYNADSMPVQKFNEDSPIQNYARQLLSALEKKESPSPSTQKQTATKKPDIINILQANQFPFAQKKTTLPASDRISDVEKSFERRYDYRLLDNGAAPGSLIKDNIYLKERVDNPKSPRYNFHG